MSQVSIIIPSYNHLEFLQKRFDSILNQTYKDWEAIIIDDKSTDESVDFINNFIKKHPEFKVKHFIVNEKNSTSGYFSWQKGIELAKTKYIWIAETDDYSELTFLEESVEILEKNEHVSLVFCSSNYVENNKIIYDSTKRTVDLNVEEGKFKIIDSSLFIKKMPFNTYIVNGSSVVFRNQEKEIPSSLFTNKQCTDIFLWTYLLKNNSFAFLNKKLNFFRRHESSTTSLLQKNQLEMVYHEKADYLNFFEQTEKYSEFIDHYIKYYIWNNKKDFLNSSSVKKIQINKNLKLQYYYKLACFVVLKVLRK